MKQVQIVQLLLLIQKISTKKLTASKQTFSSRETIPSGALNIRVRLAVQYL